MVLALLCLGVPAHADYLENLRQSDPAEFLRMVEAKAAMGEVPAEMVMAGAYEHGQYGAAQDYDKALFWYRKAAERRNGDADLAIAHFYQNGNGVGKDPAEANVWLQTAVVDGNAKALDYLGDSYLTGRGVGEDDGRAVELYHRAGRRDVIDAEVKLGGLYFHGQAVPQDYGAAYYWMRIARANPQNALYPDLDAAITSTAAKIPPAKRAAIDKQVDEIIMKWHPDTDCHEAICIRIKR